MRQAQLRVLLLVLGSFCACGGRPLPPSPSEGSGCETIGYHLSEIRYLDGGERTFMEGGALVAANGRVYYGARATTGTNSADDLDLFAVDALTGEAEQLTRDDLETVMLDAHAGSVLRAERPRGVSYKTPWRLVLDREETDPVQLGEHALRFDWHGDLYAEPARQLLDGAGAAWATESAVLYHDGTRITTVAAAQHASPPFLAGGTLVFSAHDGKDREIFRYRAGKLAQLTDNERDDRGPVLVGDEVIWLCDESICRLRAGQAEVIESGGCSPPSAGGGSAAWACGGHVSRYAPGQAIWKTPDSGAARGAGVRVDGPYLAWVEPGSDDGYNAQGTLYVSDGTRTTEVAKVGLPCIYCDAYWPPLELSFHGGLLAWSYARPTTPPDRGAAVGYLRVIPETICR